MVSRIKGAKAWAPVLMVLAGACGGSAMESIDKTQAGAAGGSAGSSASSGAPARTVGMAGDGGTTNSAPVTTAGAGGCHSEADCPATGNGPYGFESWSCFSPYDSYRCGPADGGAPSMSCKDDSECAVDRVCRNDPTLPPGTVELLCEAPCTTALDCAPNERCESDGHCKARTCADCPSYFACSAGACTIPRCTSDSDCAGGYCVNRNCSGALGSCMLDCE